MLASNTVVDRDEHGITLSQAQRIVKHSVTLLGVENVPLAKSRGRILRQDILSDVDYPTADVSGVDGYCLDASDTQEAVPSRPVLLTLKAKVLAGTLPSTRLGKGECAHVATGAVLPDGADAVTRIEDVHLCGDRIALGRPVTAGSGVRKTGEIARKGERVLEEGRLIDAKAVGLLAALGAVSVAVSKRPRVAVLATGDEVVKDGQTPGRGFVRNSNTRMLTALLADLGLDVYDAGIARDTGRHVLQGIDRCGKCDVVLLTGGTSVGEHDLVFQCLKEAHAEIGFRGLRMSPGRHMLFAKRRGQVYFSLPGGPVACLVLFHVIVRPALLAMMGARYPSPVPARARWTGPAQETSGCRTFVLSNFLPDLTVRPVRSRGRGDVLALERANSVTSFPEDVCRIEYDQIVEVFVVGPMQWTGE